MKNATWVIGEGYTTRGRRCNFTMQRGHRVQDRDVQLARSSGCGLHWISTHHLLSEYGEHLSVWSLYIYIYRFPTTVFLLWQSSYTTAGRNPFFTSSTIIPSVTGTAIYQLHAVWPFEIGYLHQQNLKASGYIDWLILALISTHACMQNIYTSLFNNLTSNAHLNWFDSKWRRSCITRWFINLNFASSPLT